MPERCTLTELLPEQCACPNHRNVQPDTSDLSDYRVGAQFAARYDGRCVLDKAHSIDVGDDVAMLIVTDTEAAAGTICTRCLGRLS